MEQRIFNQLNTMYRDAMDASRTGNDKLPSDRMRSFSRGQYGQRVTDNSSNVQDLDTLRNIQTNTWNSAGSSLWNEWNPMISDLNSEINYGRTSRDERSPDRHFRTVNRGGIWRSSPERCRENINSAPNFPNLFDNNLRMQLGPASSLGRDSYTTTSSMMENERNIGYRSTASSGLTEIEQSLRFVPPSNYNLARNGRGIPNAFVRNKTNRQHTPAQGKNWFKQPYKNHTVGSGYVGSSASNTFSKSFNIPTPSRNWKRKRNTTSQVRNESEKRSKIEAFSTSLQNAADAINVLMEMKSTTAVLSGSSLAPGKISGASVSQLSATPAKKKKKKSKNKAKAEAPSSEVKDVENLIDTKSTALISGASLTTGQIPGDSVPQLGSTPVKKKKGKARNTPEAVAPSPVVKEVKPLKKKQVVKDLKYLFTVVLRNYPMQKMTFDQIDLLKYALVQEIEKLKDRSIIPQPVRCYAPLRGSLMVYWENDNGLECLKDLVKTLKPWDGANFKVIQRGPLNFTWTVLVNKEFPNKSMTHKEVMAVIVSLANKMDEVSDDNLPQFIESCNTRGLIMIAYTKQKDFEWLKNAIQDLQPWEGAQFRLIDVDDVPVYNKIELTLPFPVSDFDGLLARLSRQNQGLDTCDWKLFDQRRKKDRRQLLVSVKDEVIKALEKIDYKPFLNLDRITVVNLGKVKNIPFSVSEFEEVLRNLKRTRTRPDDKPKLHEAPVAQIEPDDKPKLHEAPVAQIEPDDKPKLHEAPVAQIEPDDKPKLHEAPVAQIEPDDKPKLHEAPVAQIEPDDKPKLHEAPVAQIESEPADGDTGVVE